MRPGSFFPRFARSPLMDPAEDPVLRWLALKKERGCLPRTLQQYRWVARTALALLQRAGRTTDPREWSAEDARWLRRRLKEDPWRLGTLADLARCSRNFVFHEVGLPRPGPPRRVRWLSEDQARALIEVSQGDRTLRLAVLLGLAQGLRRVEWLRLRVTDIDRAGGRLLVRGKGRGQPKEVWMVMHPALPAAFETYLSWRQTAVRRALARHPLAPTPPELLVHWRRGQLVAYGEGGPNRWMTVLERRMRARGWDVKLSTHMLRRTGATLLERALLRSPDASRDGVYRSVQGFLRHENLATTMRYLERDPSRERKTMETYGRALDWIGSGSSPVGASRSVAGARPDSAPSRG